MAVFEGEQREQLSNRSEIERLLNELSSALINFENFNSFNNRVESSGKVLNTQIENLTREYKEHNIKHRETTQKDSFKQSYDDGYITRDTYDNLRMMIKILLEAFSWKSLQTEMETILRKKYYEVLGNAGALEIKKDALKEMREMQKAMQEMFIEVMQNMGNMFKERVDIKLQNYDEKLFNLIMMSDEDHRKDRRDLFYVMKQIVFSIPHLTEEKKKEIMSKVSSSSFEPKLSRLNMQQEIKETKKKESDYRNENFNDLGDEDEVSIDPKNEDIEKKIVKKTMSRKQIEGDE